MKRKIILDLEKENATFLIANKKYFLNLKVTFKDFITVMSAIPVDFLSNADKLNSNPLELLHLMAEFDYESIAKVILQDENNQPFSSELLLEDFSQFLEAFNLWFKKKGPVITNFMQKSKEFSTS